MDIYSKLTQVGLSKNEIVLYLYLLENGYSTPPKIAKSTKIQRSNTYYILEKLKERRLIEESKQGKRKVYLAMDPLSIVSYLDNQRNAIKSVLPDLRALYKKQNSKPSIKFYEGYEQVSLLIHELIDEAVESIYFIGSTDKLCKLSSADFMSFENHIWKKKVFLQDLLSGKSAQKTVNESKNRMKGFYDAFQLPEKFQDIPTSIIISGDKVALLSLEEPIFATKLTHKNLADTFIMLFDVAKISSKKI